MNSALPPGSLPGFERSLAIVIGINSYSHGVPPLLNAVRDASAVADTLERQGFEVLRLIDSQASLPALSHLLFHHLPSLQPPPDRLLLYFAGHGLAHTDEQHHLSGFLLPADARRDEPSTYWPMAALRQALGHLSCRHLLLILDCCFAGAFPHASFRDLRAPTLDAPLFLERFRHFSSRRSFQLLLSTSHDELASDRLMAKPSQEALGSGNHSPFARALLEALQPSTSADSNQDGLLTASELYTFLRDRLLTLLPSHSQQTPSLRHLDWHEGGEFLFLLSDSFPSLPSAAPLAKHSNPYLGLRPFSSEHRHLFFGRERVIDALLEHLRSHPLLLLCSPSGAGKSSIIHAGLTPRLREQSSWRIPPTVRPSSQPLQQLSSWLASLNPESPPPSPSSLEAQPHLAADFLLDFLYRHPQLSVLLVVDPLEELVTTCRDDSLRRGFLRALASLLQLSHSRFSLVLALRSDFEPHFLSLLSPTSFPPDPWRDGRFVLPPMNREELRRCIQKPAEVSVLFFASGLVERLLDDVEQMPGALPLLSVALSELFDSYVDSGRQDRTLSFEDYENLGGGIAGALQRRAELVFSGAPPPSSEERPSLPAISPDQLPAFQHTLRNVLLRMVSTEGGELTRRRVPRAELEFAHPEENARVQLALAALEASRLVVASDDSGPCVEPAHDALLSAWPRLHDWARNAQHELLLQRRVSQAAAEWLRENQPVTLLWADARLDPLGFSPAFLRATHSPLALLRSSPGGQPTVPVAFNHAECKFLQTSAVRRHRLRIRRYALTLAIAASLVTLTIAAFFQSAEAQRNASEAQQQKEAALASTRSEQKAKEAALASERKARGAEAQARTATELAAAYERVKQTTEQTNDALMIALERARAAARLVKQAQRMAHMNAQAAQTAEAKALAAAEALKKKLQEEQVRIQFQEVQAGVLQPTLAAAQQSELESGGSQEQPWAKGVPPDKQAAALALFRDGNFLLKNSLFWQARKKYQEALNLWDHPAIHFNMALVLMIMRVNEPTALHHHLTQSMRYGEAPLDNDKYERAHALKKHIEQQFSYVDIICEVEGTTVLLDGKKLFKAPGRYQGFVTPGPHAFSTTKAGYLRNDRWRDLAPGQKHQLTIRP